MTVYDFGTGNTNPEDFPADALAAAAAAAIPKSVVALNRYTGGLGHPELRQILANRESDREGVPVDPDQIALTNGSMQGVTLVGEVLMQGHDDIVITEEFTYSGTISAYRTLGIQMIGMPCDGHGMRMDALADTLADLHAKGTPPRFIYTLATYQNPICTTMPLERRLELIALAKKYDCIVVEDNCYGDVHYEGDKPKALYALDDDPRHIYLCSLSKIFAPGIRLGYILARPPWFNRLLGRRNDAGPNTLAASIMAEYFKDGVWEHTEAANVRLKKKRDALLDGLEQHLGNVCTWTHPVGGLFLWLKLPEDVDYDAFKDALAERNVQVADGSAFDVTGNDRRHIRLAFGYPSVEIIQEGIPKLAEAIAAVRRTAG